MPATLAIDAAAARIGGGVSRVRELAQTLPVVAPDHRYLLFASQEVLSHVGSMDGVCATSLPPWAARVPARLAWEHAFLPRRLAREAPDWLLSPFNVLPLGPGLPRSTRRALIVSNIGPFIRQDRRTLRTYQVARQTSLRALTTLSLRRADVIFLLSREAQAILESHLGRARRVVRLPMAPPSPAVIDLAAGLEPLPELDTPFFLAAGDLLPHKGFEDAVRAIARLDRALSGPRLVLAGKWHDRNYASGLVAMSREMAPGRVLFLSDIDQIRVLNLMRNAVATLFTSRFENTSRVPVEAMAVDCPLLVADTPNGRDECSDAALYYPPGDDAALAELMRLVVEDGGARASLVGRGRRLLQGVDWLSATRALMAGLELV